MVPSHPAGGRPHFLLRPLATILNHCAADRLTDPRARPKDIKPRAHGCSLAMVLVLMHGDTFVEPQASLKGKLARNESDS
jgi:hypothetical protein